MIGKTWLEILVFLAKLNALVGIHSSWLEQLRFIHKCNFYVNLLSLNLATITKSFGSTLSGQAIIYTEPEKRVMSRLGFMIFKLLVMSIDSHVGLEVTIVTWYGILWMCRYIYRTHKSTLCTIYLERTIEKGRLCGECRLTNAAAPDL